MHPRIYSELPSRSAGIVRFTSLLKAAAAARGIAGQETWLGLGLGLGLGLTRARCGKQGRYGLGASAAAEAGWPRLAEAGGWPGLDLALAGRIKAGG